MLSPFRFAGIITVIFAVCGPARGQAIAPAGSGVTIDKVDVYNGLAHTVKYYVKGGSPRLQALVRRVEWAENELSVIEQLQLLKLDTVVNERHAAAFRTAQLTNPYYPPGFIPLSIATNNGCDGASPLQRALTGQLAYEATPQAALQLIGFLEQQQTELDAQLKALPPKEKKAAQGPIDALRPRLAALSRSDVRPPRSQPVVTGHRLQGGPPAPAPTGAKAAVEVQWGGSWYAAEVLRVNGGLTLIHYTGWNSSWDEWIPDGRIRPAGAVSAPPQLAMPPDSVALQQTVRQYQETVRQQIMQTQQQTMQRHREIIQQHLLLAMGLQR
ncbi:MAG TPA: Tudor-knot domain-containing protein [Gemmataceae bacterium]|nr:Tudor-knot domain-containing protein [Gemmataceae bacterium]